MSLNGLDNPKVAEAYEAAAAEPGGWFLLKYASRDEVELLNQGKGGVVEVRNTVAAYEETNPLYGFLKYRRRNVLIKYLPEGCSRLIQARVAVHFNAVCDRFSPYDSQFEITTSDELRDSRLSAACSLHAASGSNSSSGSLRRKHLMEIAEEDEEEQQQPTKRQSLIKDGDEDKENQSARMKKTEPAVTLNKDLASSPEQTKFSAPTTSEMPNFVGASATSPEDPSTADDSRRMSSQSSRELFSSYSAYTYTKPRVKLGPRPSVETNARPQTAGNFRPISSIPAGFKLFGKGGSSSGKKSGRKDSIGSASAMVGSPQSELTEISFAGATLPIPEEPKTHLDTLRPATSSGVSTKSTAMSLSSKHAMTPEKARLKKAMQLREKKRKAAGKVPTITTKADSNDDAQTTDDKTENTEAKVSNSTEDSKKISMVKADSGVAISTSPASTKGGDQASEVTQTDSRPTSPIVTSSDAEQQSTKASSVSDATEQTIEASEKKDTGEVTSSESTPRATEALPGAQKQPNQDSVKRKAQQADGIAAPASKAGGNIPAPSTSTTTAQAEGKASETQGIPDKHQANVTQSTGSDEQQNGKLATATIKVDPPTGSSKQNALKESPEIFAREPTADEQAKADAETIAARHKKQLSLKRAKTHVEPIRTDLTRQSRPVSQSEISFSDSESLFEELQSATVQEAKPMFVSKTPLTPVFPGQQSSRGPTSPPGSSASNKPHIVRTVSNPVRGNLVPPGDVSQSSARSVSQGGAAYLHQVTQQRNGDSNAAKKNVGSTISQRIKALELLSANSAETGSQSGSRPSSTFFSVKKDRVPSRSPSVVDRTNTLSKDTRPSTSQSMSREHSPGVHHHRDRDRSTSISSRLSVFESVNSPGNTPRGRPESISVTAKILRDAPSQSRNQPDNGHLDLKQSPLTVDHHRAEETSVSTPPDVTVEPAKETLLERRTRAGSKDSESRRQSLSMAVRDFIKEGRKSLASPSSDNLTASSAKSPSRPPSTHKNSSFTGRLSIGSRRSLSKDRDGVASVMSDDSEETRSNSDKKISRAGRLMRRLSNLSGSSRNKVSSPGDTPTVEEEEFSAPPSTSHGDNSSSPSVVTYMGDVNVQFPDTLLWKRRNMYLDSQGFVTLNTATQQQQQQQRGGKRYHLSDFRMPYIPDVDAQELPNSVVLDLVEGSAVQIACGDRAGQMNVLQILRDAYAAQA